MLKNGVKKEFLAMLLPLFLETICELARPQYFIRKLKHFPNRNTTQLLVLV